MEFMGTDGDKLFTVQKGDWRKIYKGKDEQKLSVELWRQKCYSNLRVTYT
jgi:hypothetical protein